MMPDTTDNTDTADTFRSFTGQPESTTPPETSPTATRDSSANRAPQPPSASASASASDSASMAPMRPKTLSGTRSLNVSGSPSNVASPMSSRDTSPARPSHRQAGSSGTLPKSGLRSRKSSTDVSPNRGTSYTGPSSTVPSAAAIQRALSSANIPQLPPAVTQDPSRVPRPLKSTSGANSGDNTPYWPLSPRLKSPPPNSDIHSRSRQNSLRAQLKKPEVSSTPAIVVQSSSPAPVSRMPMRDEGPSSDPEEPPMSMKTSPRGVSGAAPKLETVQESSLPPTPGSDGLTTPSFPPTTQKSFDDERNDVMSSKITEDLSVKISKHAESGSDSGIKNDTQLKMQELRSPTSAQRPGTTLRPKSSFSSLATNKPRTETPSRNMTVETETVPSIPQATIGNQDRSVSGRTDGSLRPKASIETIRPRKEKRAAKRKAPSIHSGTSRSPRISYHPQHDQSKAFAASLSSPVLYRSYDDPRSMLTMSPPSPTMTMQRLSRRSPSLNYFYSSANLGYHKASSKADVFEQKVASAVDEANSSDSDATFIYESNPPEQQQPHRSRHHSRTPSMTSIASLIDPRQAIRDAHKNPGKKASMKFANPYNNPNADMDMIDRGDGTIRLGSGRVSGGNHHHHMGRHGQGRGTVSSLIMDNSDSSMPQSSRARGPSSRHPSQPNSPRFHTFNIGNGSSNGNGTSINGNGNGNGIKKHEQYSAYDIDTENAADDERTPLISTLRSPRVRTPRRRNSITLRHMDRRHRRNGGWCRRFAGCLVMSILLLVLIFSAAGLVFATTKPLIQVKIREIVNVIASPEEIMLDMMVEAVNPNIIAVTIADMEVSIFARSKHVGSDKWWRDHDRNHENNEDWLPVKVDTTEENVPTTNGIDEGTDPIEDPEVYMLLGRISRFDSPLNFDGSFFSRHVVESPGEIRLAKPGNKTEAGGTERWEEVLQYPFELIVKGVFKYQLPLSTRDLTVLVNAVYYYDPDAEKKKVKLPHVQLLEDGPRTRNLPEFVKTITKPLGRFDLRERSSPLLDP